MTGVEMDGKRLCAVICTDILTGEKTKYKAKLFADCSGDAVLSRLAGAEVMYGREAQSVFGESLAPKEHQKLVMGHSIRWYTEKTDVPIPCAFEGLTNAEEAYHFKDAGWFSLDHPENSERHDPAALRKLKNGIAALGFLHKYPLPKEVTEEDTEE